MPTTHRASRALLPGALALLMLGVAACSSDPQPADPTAGEQAPEPGPTAEILITPVDGTDEVRPDLPVTVEADGGTLTDVQVRTEGVENTGADEMTGTFNEDETGWTSDWTLTPGAKVTVTATAETPDGETVEATSDFETLPATDGRRLELQSNFPTSGDTVGVGMPVVVNFDLPVSNKAQVEAAMEVVSDEPTEGAWNWFGDQMVVFRTKEYWTPGQEVTVNMHLAGVNAAEGVYGVKNHQLNFEVGRSQITTVDDSSHRMVIERDGEQIKDFPISNGEATTRAYTTTSGTHLTMEKYQHLVMDSATVGIPEGHPDYYKLDVNYAVRFSNSGEFTHAAPWNSSLGQANLSHGCTNMSTGDAKWFYENSLMGDPYIVEGTDRELEVDNGWGYWQRSWEEWLDNSETGEADKTDEAGSPGSPHSES
ncbi:L,D-transpeptidase [Nocardiopsis ansamitocini]|uniref:L,D-TPase catalytic domain-containing protein n=1 Tax=Nocardiopsis ansamitocini TaxID=1670832 RepID=A0A9W6P7A4_9ACTN|nr:Ig-like domain-containing protein [Nocardiopsis ansamitocini]GLU48805.1 hypothetical protein Nans01_31560 [Nocardiopsis ansamitocini]